MAGQEKLSIEMTFEWRYEGREVGHKDTWGKSISGNGNSMYKGLEVGTGVAGVKMRKKEGLGMEWEVGGHSSWVVGQDGNRDSSPLSQ